MSRASKSPDKPAPLRCEATENMDDSPPAQKLETTLQEPVVLFCTLLLVLPRACSECLGISCELCSTNQTKLLRMRHYNLSHLYFFPFFLPFSLPYIKHLVPYKEDRCTERIWNGVGEPRGSRIGGGGRFASARAVGEEIAWGPHVGLTHGTVVADREPEACIW